MVESKKAAGSAAQKENHPAQKKAAPEENIDRNRAGVPDCADRYADHQRNRARESRAAIAIRNRNPDG